MPRTIVTPDRTIQVPDDASDEDIRGILSQGAASQPAGANSIDPHFLAPMPAFASGAAASAHRIDPRFLAPPMSPVSLGGTTVPGNAGQDSIGVKLGLSLGYAAQQDPDQYSRLLHLQDLTGIPPIVSAGRETQIQQAVNAKRIDPRFFTTIAPVTSVWASNPDNAAVAGVDEILRFGGIEQNAAAMRAVPSLNAFLNRYGNAAIPTSADDPQVQAWKRVASFWQAMGKGVPKPVDPLTAIANQALARQHAADTAFRATPRPEPTTIAEEAQQATTPRTLQVYTPAAPTVAPLPAAPMPDMQLPGVMETLAPGLTELASSLWHNIVGGESDSQRETREAYERVTAGQAHEGGKVRRARALAISLMQAPPFTAEDIERHLGTSFTSEQMAKALSAQDSVRAGRVTPDQLDPETRNLYEQLETGTQAVRASLPALFAASGVSIPAPVLESTIDFAGGMLSPSNVAMMAVLPESRVLSALFALQGIKASYGAATEALQAYRSGDKDRAARFATTAVLNAVMGGMAGLHAARGVAGGLGYERAASEGLTEGAREVMGGSSATEPVVGVVPGPGTFFENLSQAIEAASDSKLRGRSPHKFYEALQAIFQGNDSLRIPVRKFDDYFTVKSIDPEMVAEEIGAVNYADAATRPGGNVEVPTENFLGKLDPQHQWGLLPDVVDPTTDSGGSPQVESLSQLTGNMDDAERRYDSMGQPNNVSGDRVKELLQGWNDKGNRPMLEEKEHNDASKIAYNLFYRKAARLPEGSDVHLVTGPVAAGKSTAIKNESGLSYEVNLSNQDKAFEHLDRLLDMGLKPSVSYVYTTPELSVERRASRAEADGRSVRIDRSTAAHLDLPGSIRGIADHYGDRVKIKIYDNSVTPTREVPVSELGKLAYTGTQEDLLEQQQRHLDSLLDRGRISPELHRQLSRGTPEIRGRESEADAGELEQSRGAGGGEESGGGKGLTFLRDRAEPLLEDIGLDELKRADAAYTVRNAANAKARTIWGDERTASAIALNPHAYAYLRKVERDFRGDYWRGVHLRPDYADYLLKRIEKSSSGLPETVKAPVVELMRLMRENRTADGDIVLIRDGLHPRREPMTLGEERMHVFQDRHPVDDDWLDKYPRAAGRARKALDYYPSDQIPNEISAKLLSGNRIWLSIRDAELLIEAYKDKLKESYPEGILDKLPDLKGNEERLRGPQFRD